MILRIHYNFNLKGGAEYDILKLIDSFEKYGKNNWKNYLLLIHEHKNGQVEAKLQSESNSVFFNHKVDVKKYLEELINKLKIKVIHIHSQPTKKITQMIFGLNLPVFRSMHEAMIICPGWAKYWLTEDKPCQISFGPKCLINAYTKKCTRSRNPINLYNAYTNVYYEINTASKKYEGIFVYSDFMLNEALKSGISQKKIIKIPSPQYDKFENLGKKNIENKKLIIYSGRLSKQKGVTYLIEAAARLRNEGRRDFKVLIFGEGPLEKHLKELVKDENLSDFISFFGWVDRSILNEYYKKSHIAVIPSTYPDNFPNSVAESMLAKMVVIAFDSGGTCEWFKDGVSGIKTKSKNQFSLAQSIEEVLDYPESLESIGSRARKEILLNHSLEKTFNAYKDVYDTVL